MRRRRPARPRGSAWRADRSLRSELVRCLGEFGRNAREAVPELTRLLHTGDSGIDAAYALAGIGVLQAAEWFAYYAGWADKLGGHVAPVAPGDVLDYTSSTPHGVVGAIIPWNGPLFAATMVMAPALAAGNCIVVKSPDLAPYSVMSSVTSRLNPSPKHKAQHDAQTTIASHGVCKRLLVLASTFGSMPSCAMASGKRE